MSNITTNVTSHFSERHKYTDSQVKLLRSFVLRCEALQFMTHGSYLFYLKWYKLLNIPTFFLSGTLMISNGIFEPENMKIPNILTLGATTALMLMNAKLNYNKVANYFLDQSVAYGKIKEDIKLELASGNENVPSSEFIYSISRRFQVLTDDHKYNIPIKIKDRFIADHGYIDNLPIVFGKFRSSESNQSQELAKVIINKDEKGNQEITVNSGNSNIMD